MTIVEVLNSRIALDLETLCKLLILSRINFGEFDLTLKLRSSAVPFRLKCFTMTAPRRIKLNKPDIFRSINFAVEVRVS